MSTTIRCVHCGAVCPAEARFCVECGKQVVAVATGPTTRLPKLHCPVCQAANEPGGRFCGRCGADLFAPRPTVQPSQPPSPPPAQHSYPRVGTPPPTIGRPAQTSMQFPPWAFAAIAIIGVFVLLSHHIFWPGILLVGGVGSYLHKSNTGQSREGMRQLLWLGGIALLIATGTFWPGIIVLFVLNKMLD